jgi:hypothetical protein
MVLMLLVFVMGRIPILFCALQVSAWSMRSVSAVRGGSAAPGEGRSVCGRSFATHSVA